jgi:hypothetical protein
MASHLSLTRPEPVHQFQARVTFTASGPFGLQVRGRGSDMCCFVDREAVVFAVPLGSLSTGISMRDRTMLDLFQASRFPDAELRIPRAAILVPQKKGIAEGNVQATLTLRGQSGPVQVSYTLKRQGNALEITGGLSVLASLWGVKLPRHMGFGLKSLVAVKVQISAAADALTNETGRLTQRVRTRSATAAASDVG